MNVDIHLLDLKLDLRLDLKVKFQNWLEHFTKIKNGKVQTDKMQSELHDGAIQTNYTSTYMLGKNCENYDLTHTSLSMTQLTQVEF